MATSEKYEKLPLESSLDESPQIHSLVDVYAQDASALREYVKSFHEISSQIVAAHNRLTSTYQDLSKLLRHFSPQKYIPESDPSNELSNILKDFADKISEMSSWEHILATQIADGVVYPLSKFIGSDLQEISSLGSLYQNTSNDVDRAISRYSRCKKRDLQQERHEAVEDVYNTRKTYHAVALKYYARLNQLQMGRECALLQPVLGMITASKSHYNLGQDFLSSLNTDDFLTSIATRLNTTNENLLKEREDTDEMINSIITQSQLMYYPQPPGELSRLPPDTTLMSKSGYLNTYRKYMGVMSSWERQFVFIEGGNLMSAHKGDLAGSLLLELDNTTLAHAADTDDRLHVFTVITAKRSVTLQGLNDRERDEWMLTIQKIAKEGGYVRDESKSTPDSTSSSFLAGVSQFFAGKRHSGSTDSNISPSQDGGVTVGPPSGSPARRQLRGDVIPKDAPIFFDISAIEEDANIVEESEMESKSSEASSTDEASLQDQEFSVHFLGCIKVNVDAVESFLAGQSVVFEVMRRILAARAIHDMFSTSHLKLIISTSHLALKDHNSGAVRVRHPLKDVAFWAAHSENPRLVGYIVRSSNDFSCYVYESDNGGREICSAFGAAARHAYSHLLDQKTHQEKRKQETRLLLDNIALLQDKNSVPDLSADGSHVILDSEEEKPPQRKHTSMEKKPESEA